MNGKVKWLLAFALVFMPAFAGAGVAVGLSGGPADGVSADEADPVQTGLEHANPYRAEARPSTHTFSFTLGAPAAMNLEYGVEHGGWQVRLSGGAWYLAYGAQLEMARCFSMGEKDLLSVGLTGGYMHLVNPMGGSVMYDAPYAGVSLRSEMFDWLVVGADAGATVARTDRIDFDANYKTWTFFRVGYFTRWDLRPRKIRKTRGMEISGGKR